MNTLKQLENEIKKQESVVETDRLNLLQMKHAYNIGDETERSLNWYKLKLQISESLLESYLVIKEKFEKANNKFKKNK